jgi:YcxB-like protein
MTYSFQTTPGELSRVMKHMAYRSLWTHVWFWAGLILPVGLLLFDGFARANADEGKRSPLAVWPLAVVVWGIVVASPLRRRRIVRAMFRSKAAGLPLRYDFAEGGIQITASGAVHQVKWSGIDELDDTDEFVLMIYRKWTYYFVPKRVVPEDERQELWKLLRRHVPAPA